MPRQFRIDRPSMEVSSSHRPDHNWRFVDSGGHLHEWYTGGRKAVSYEPTKSYDVPFIRWIETCPASDEYPAEGHYVCILCSDRVKPGYTADTVAQYIQGPAKFYIDDLPVDSTTWFAEYKLDYPELDPKLTKIQENLNA